MVYLFEAIFANFFGCFNIKANCENSPSMIKFENFVNMFQKYEHVIFKATNVWPHSHFKHELLWNDVLV